MGTVSRRIVVMEHKGVLCPLFRPLSPDLLSQSLQDFKIVVLVHCLTRWSKFIVNLLSERIFSFTTSMFPSVFEGFGLPERWSSSVDSLPSLNLLCHSNVLLRLRAASL